MASPQERSAPSPETARLAEELGVPEERLARALAGAQATPAALLDALRRGTGDPRLQDVARSLKVGQERLGAALLVLAEEGPALAGRAATAAEGFAAAAKGAAEDALAIGLEIVSETLPRLVGQMLAVFAATGVALVAVGLLALVDTPLFVRLLGLLAGIALVAAGALLFVLAWKLHEATAGLRMLAKVARRWRARHPEP